MEAGILAPRTGRSPRLQDTLISLDKDKMGQREITFTKTISIFMMNVNLRLDSFSECTGLGLKGEN